MRIFLLLLVLCVAAQGLVSAIRADTRGRTLVISCPGATAIPLEHKGNTLLIGCQN